MFQTNFTHCGAVMILIALIIVGGSRDAVCGIVVEYDLTGHPAHTPAPATTLHSGILASNWGFGPGVTTAGGTQLVTATGWTTDSELDPDDYVGFTVSPKAGATMSLETLTFVERRSHPSGPLEMAVRSSLDNFATDIFQATLPGDAAYRTRSINLPIEQFSSLTTSIEIRIYAYGAISAAGAWRFAGSGFLNDDSYPPGLTVTGTVIPEPAAVSLIFIASGALACRRCKT